ncbi:hypothetical protein RCH10_004522 [Variovorax sp. GrIS 2.14]
MGRAAMGAPTLTRALRWRMANTAHWLTTEPITIAGVPMEPVTGWLHVFRATWTDLADGKADPEHVADIGNSFY